ncbi:MAG TPA: hypothetical protein VF426_00220, partial [Marmoricola sp.]
MRAPTALGLLVALLTGPVLVSSPSSATAARKISLTAPRSATAGARITVHGVLTHSPAGSRIILKRRAGSSWVRVARTRTRNRKGTYTRTIRVPSHHGTFRYRAFAPKRSKHRRVTSKVRKVVVRTTTTVSLTAVGPAPLAHTTDTLSGTVRPWGPRATVTLQQRAGTATRWSRVGPVSPGPHGRFTTTVAPSDNGTTRYRVVVSARHYYTAAVSPTIALAPTMPVTTPLRWQAPEVVDRAQTSLVSVSCPTPSFCAAVDAYGNVVTRTSAGWSAPVNVLADHAFNGAISCSSKTFCVAVWSDSESDEHYSAFDGSAWSAPARVGATGGSGPQRLSCVNRTFCMLVGSGNYWTVRFNGSSWVDAQELPSSISAGGDGAISCASTTRCVLTVAGKYAHVWNGSTWG